MDFGSGSEKLLVSKGAEAFDPDSLMDDDGYSASAPSSTKALVFLCFEDESGKTIEIVGIFHSISFQSCLKLKFQGVSLAAINLVNACSANSLHLVNAFILIEGEKKQIHTSSKQKTLIDVHVEVLSDAKQAVVSIVLGESNN